MLSLNQKWWIDSMCRHNPSDLKLCREHFREKTLKWKVQKKKKPSKDKVHLQAHIVKQAKPMKYNYLL
jgi:hypothetical protein